MQRLVQETGSRRIEGTTDIIRCIEQRQLLDRVSVRHALQQHDLRLSRVSKIDCHSARVTFRMVKTISVEAGLGEGGSRPALSC